MSDTTTQDLAEDNVALELPIELKARRGKGVGVAVVMGLVAAAMVWAALVDAGAWAWAVAVLCALLALVGVSMAIRPSTLRIAEDGFTVDSFMLRLRGGVPVTVPWSHVDGFGAIRIGQGSFVRYDYTEASGRVRVPGGVMLPDTFGLPAPALAGMLQACRDGIGAAADAPAAT